MTPVGTMAHEWIMCTGQGNHKHNPLCIFQLVCPGCRGERVWHFERNCFDGYDHHGLFPERFPGLTYSTLFSGVRHDSGDPFAWGEKLISHYESLGIDPKRKTLLFSDGLDFARADELRKAFRDRVTVAFGIGT